MTNMGRINAYPITSPTSSTIYVFMCHLEQLMKNIEFFVSKRRSVLSAIKILIISFNEVERNIGTEEGGGYQGGGWSGTSLLTLNQFSLKPSVADLIHN